MNWTWIAVLGLLAAVLLVFITAFRNRGASEYPYNKKPALLSAAERSFLGVLEQVLNDRYRIYVQVRLADLLEVRRGLDKSRCTSAQNRINSKHADFVLCHKDTLQIVCAIELDDASHQRPNRKSRDNFFDEACRVAGLPLARFSAKRGYSVQEVRATLENVISAGDTPQKDSEVAPAQKPQQLTSGSSGPTCPRCGGDTILRTVKSGAHAGRQLWGCRSYPSCKGFIPV